MDIDFDEFARQYEAELTAAVSKMSPRWGVKSYKSHGTMDGVAYAFRLTDNGSSVAHVEDAGVGGGPNIYWDERDSSASQAFDEEAKRLFPNAGALAGESMVEAVLQRAGK